MTLRPVGHITKAIRELERWRFMRTRRKLDVKPLDTAITYLTEYRELTGEVRNDLAEQRRHEDA